MRMAFYCIFMENYFKGSFEGLLGKIYEANANFRISGKKSPALSKDLATRISGIHSYKQS